LLCTVTDLHAEDDIRPTQSNIYSYPSIIELFIISFL